MSILFIFYLGLGLVLHRDIFTTPWLLSGDDIVSLQYVPRNAHELFKLFSNLNGQYRPLTYVLFGFLLSVREHIALLHFIIIGLLAYVSLLLYMIAKRLGLNWMLSVLVGAFVTSSQIFLYHFYTISSLADILIMIAGLLSFLLFLRFVEKRDVRLLYAIAAIGLITLFIKETYILIPAGIGLYVIFDRKISKQSRLALLALVSVPSLIYIPLKLAFYHPTAPEYTPHLSVAVIGSNLSYYSAWITGANKGWQMFLPNPLPRYYFVLVLLNLLSLIMMYVLLFRKKRVFALALALAIVLSLAPMLFFPRPMVYYLDLTVLGIVIAFATVASKNKLGVMLLCSYMAITFTQGLVVQSQWSKYSFVAVANSTVESLKSHISKPGINTVCINSVNTGVLWAIDQGYAAKLYNPAISNVLLTQDKPLTCTQKNAVYLYDKDGQFINLKMTNN